MTTRLFARVLAVLAVLFALATPARADDVTAVNDQATTPVGQAVQIDVLANDQGTQLTAAVTTPPTNGDAVVNVDNTITYTPNQGFRGTDSFQYEASDGDGDTSAPASVDLIVDDPPVANNDDFPTVVKNTSLSPQDVLGNDTDPNGDQLTVASVSAPGFGTTQAGNTSVLYTPDPGYTGPDSFTYKASDGLLESQEATVTVNVVEGVATASGDSYDVNQGQTLTVDSTAGVLANDGDLDGDTLSAVLDGLNPGPSNGTFTSGLDADGSFTYVPAPDFFGDDSFTYHADDGNGGASASATVVIHVNGTPVATDDSIATGLGTPVQSDVRTNDSDPDGDGLTITGTTDGAHGTVTHDAHTVTYTPDGAYQGPDSFTYTIADPHGATATATVNVVVDDPPVGAADSYSVGKNAALTVTAPGVLGNDTDADQGDAVSASAGTPPAHGSLTLAPDGSFTYTPDPGFTGPDSFTYVPNDGLRDGQPVAVSISVNEQAPVAVAHSLTTTAGTPKIVDLLAGVSDPDGDVVAVKSVGQPTGHTGTVVNNKNGTATYTPAQGVCNATDLFAYTVGDGHGATSSANVSVTVSTQRTAGTIKLTPSATLLPFAGSVTLSVHLGSFVPGEKVTFTRIPFGQAARPVGSATVDSHGNAHLTVTGLQLGSTFRASSPKENCFLAATSQGVFVAVRANVTGHMAGAYALKNGYALYHEGTAPLFRGAVAPNHAGQSVTFQWQQNSGKGWQPYLSQAQGLDSNSRIAVFLSSGAVKGPAYRVRIVWPGGSGSAASAAPWSYFKVTS